MAQLFCFLWLLVITVIIATFGSSTALETLPSARISNGDITQISKYPYIVSVRRRSCNDCAYEHFCGGTIFNEKFIITSANCVRTAVVRDLLIVAGSSLREGALQNGGMLFPVQEITVHEDESIDLAILRLALELPINSSLSVKAVKFATSLPKTGTLAVTAGWGRIGENGDYSEELRETTVPILDLEQCSTNSESVRVTDNEICAGNIGGDKNTCQGDAGGPLLVNNELIGITSWSVDCATGSPGTYTNIVKLGDWIVSHVLGVHIAFL